MIAWKSKFYKSTGWIAIRWQAIIRDKHTCRFCNKIIIGSPEVHHTIELTEANYTNPEISLNLDLLVTLHKKCHNLIHKRFGGVIEKETMVDDELNIDYSKRG